MEAFSKLRRVVAIGVVCILAAQLCQISGQAFFCAFGCCHSCVFITCDDPAYSCQYCIHCCEGLPCLESTNCE